MKRAVVALLLASQGVVALRNELPKAVAPDHVGHGADHVPPGHKADRKRVGGPRPGDPGFGIHTPPNRHTRGEGNEHDQTHHHLELHYDEVIMDLHEEAKEIHHAHGHESSEAHDHNLKIEKVRNKRKALHFKAQGMSDDEYDHLVDLYDQLSEMMHKPHERHEEMSDVHKGDADLEARHKEMTKHHDVQRQIREIEYHYEHVPPPRNNVGNAEERKAMREMYEKLKTTTDREAKKKLRLEYETRMQHLHDDQNHHGTLSEDELAEVYALREELLAETDPDERTAIRADIEDIYRKHRHQKRLHNRNPHHPDNLDSSREEEDEILIDLRQQMERAGTREERKAIQEKVRDRIHELHYGHVDEDIRPTRPGKRKKDGERKRKLPESKLKGPDIPKPED